VIFRQAAAAFALASFLLLGLNWAAGSHEFHRSLDRIPWFGFMHGITILGDGLFAAAIALWLVLRRATKSEWITFILGFAAAALIPQIGKNLIWPEVLRPYGVVSGIKHSPWFEHTHTFPRPNITPCQILLLRLPLFVPTFPTVKPNKVGRIGKHEIHGLILELRQKFDAIFTLNHSKLPPKVASRESPQGNRQ
jgi:hypothetical protein